MKEKKDKHLRVRLTESQLQSLVQYLIENPNEFKTSSQLIRESIKQTICRKKNQTHSKK